MLLYASPWACYLALGRKCPCAIFVFKRKTEEYRSPCISCPSLSNISILFPKHPELADKNVPNLHVMKAMQSLKSRGYVKEQFAWRHFYWYLTNEGIQYLRDYLHLPPEIVPATLRRSRPETGRPRPKGPEGERPARFTRGEADRDTYRRSAVPPGADKKAEAGAGSATEFQFVSISFLSALQSLGPGQC